jgi:alanyl-tRNA synthetase
MTEQLCYIQPILTSCEATVLSCGEKNGRFHITLDRTVIFPEGGGQLCDRGTVGNAEILDAQEKSGDVIHICDRPLPVGSRVTVALDLPRRLDHTEQHTGEHILSGLAFKLYGARNVGFHMAEDYCTIDLDTYLDEDALAELEAEANDAVRQNLPVTEEHMDHAKLESITIRKKADIKSDDIRVVWIGAGDVDSCTCCGTHCARTGEVGYIRIVDSQKYKGGVRLWFSCGGRAVREANGLNRSLTALARSYSTSREELPAAIRKQSDELSSAKRDLKARTQTLCDMMAEANREALAITLVEGFTANDVKTLSESLIAKNAQAALVFGACGGTTYYRAARREGVKAPMNELIKAVNGLVGGKGGGSPAFAQGSTAEKVGAELLETLRGFANKWFEGNK